MKQPKKKKRKFCISFSFSSLKNSSLPFSTSRRNWNEERRINAETFGLKYRPAQGNNQRNGQAGYYNSNRRYNAGQQSYYGNNNRYQRGGGSYGSAGQQRNRNTTYYGNTNKRMQAY